MSDIKRYSFVFPLRSVMEHANGDLVKYEDIKHYPEQLAAAQLENQKMREALQIVHDQLIEGKPFTQQMHPLPYWRYSVNDALETPTTTQHLQDYVELKIAERLGEPVAEVASTMAVNNPGFVYSIISPKGKLKQGDKLYAPKKASE